MQIMLKVSGVEWWIAVGPTREIGKHVGPFNVQHSSRLLAQVSQVLRSGYVKAFNRGNVATRISFSTSVVFANLRDSGNFATSWPTFVPRTGDLTFVMTLGAVINKLIFANSVMEDVTTSQIGVSVTVNYSFVGGILTS